VFRDVRVLRRDFYAFHVYSLLAVLSHSSLCSLIEIYLLLVQINYYSVLIFALHNVNSYYAFYLTKHCTDSVHCSKIKKSSY
jgi:hypothetical protein